MSPIHLTGLEEAITEVVERVGPAVVTIATVQLLRDQFYRPFPVEGVGSGVVVSDDGLIVTNHHVVRGARHANVIFPDGKKYQATYVGGDPQSDLAVLRIPARGLAKATLGDSDRLKVGQLAIAIGSPFGQMLEGPTVTVGVVSALKRHLRSPEGEIEDLVQTDAPINPGNSGGALLDSNGDVIAINTAIIPHAQGIGFAVPVNRVREVLGQIVDHGSVRRAWLGVAGTTLTPEISAQRDIFEDDGVVVMHVEEGSPAQRAGVREGDLIRSFGGSPVPTVEELQRKVRAARLGREVRLGIVRGTRELHVDLVLREKPGPSEPVEIA